jgi:hypothetical protein
MVSQYRFRVKIECPTDACAANLENRIKLVEYSNLNDRPSWDSLNGCRNGVHGMLGGKAKLPTFTYVPIDGTAPGTVNAANCQSPLHCDLSGGLRQDYKEFGREPGQVGFQFIMGTTNHEHRNFHRTKIVDACYCNGNCNVASSWFKVGSMRLSPTRLVSSATSRSNLPEQWQIEFMNQPGIVGLSRPYADADALGLQENGLLKIVADATKSLNDDGCAFAGYNSQLTSGLANEVSASMNYLSKRQTQTPPDLQKLVFNSDSVVNTITVIVPGNIAVCYCAITVDSQCVVQSNWKLLAHLTIKGPLNSQRWTFSTNVVFRFSYEGYGLTSGDKLRIISSDGSCTSNNFNPKHSCLCLHWPQRRVPCPLRSGRPCEFPRPRRSLHRNTLT